MKNLLSFLLAITLLPFCTDKKDKAEQEGKDTVVTVEKQEAEMPKEKEPEKVKLDFSAGPPAVVYKTKMDYSDKVAVGLSEDKSRIISYPHPSDVYYNGQLAFPTKLTDGYLLDNQGIGANAAFLNITLKEYSQYKQAPKLQELYNSIIDKEPLLEFYNCGNRNSLKNEVEKLNLLIESGQLGECR